MERRAIERLKDKLINALRLENEGNVSGLHLELVCILGYVEGMLDYLEIVE